MRTDSMPVSAHACVSVYIDQGRRIVAYDDDGQTRFLACVRFQRQFDFMLDLVCYGFSIDKHGHIRLILA